MALVGSARVQTERRPVAWSFRRRGTSLRVGGVNASPDTAAGNGGIGRPGKAPPTSAGTGIAGRWPEPPHRELAFYHCYSPRPVLFGQDNRAALGHRGEFQASKGLTGLDEHQVRRWTS